MPSGGRSSSRQRAVSRCSLCDRAGHDIASLDAETYAYVLGLYLGDGHVRAYGRSRYLRLAFDRAYPGIVNSSVQAIADLADGREPSVRADTSGKALVLVDSCWSAWPCLLPQHGPGRKHTRPIVLTDWQQNLVDQAPGALLRGLIHTDGWRGTNRVVSKGHAYEYPRYQFSNRSEDIRRLFTDACEALGIEWRRWTRYHVSVAKRESVALLDRYVGPKT